MRTRKCNFCGLRIEVKRTLVWNWKHFSDTGKWIQTHTGPFPDPNVVIQMHENHCARDMMFEHYGTLNPLENWSKSRTS